MYNQFLIYIENYDEETWKKKAEEHHEKLDDVIIFKKKFQMLKQEKDGQNKEYTCFKGSDDIEEWAPKWNGKLSEVIKEIFKWNQKRFNLWDVYEVGEHVLSMFYGKIEDKKEGNFKDTQIKLISILSYYIKLFTPKS